MGDFEIAWGGFYEDHRQTSFSQAQLLLFLPWQLPVDLFLGEPVSPSNGQRAARFDKLGFMWCVSTLGYQVGWFSREPWWTIHFLGWSIMAIPTFIHSISFTGQWFVSVGRWSISCSWYSNSCYLTIIANIFTRTNKTPRITTTLGRWRDIWIWGPESVPVWITPRKASGTCFGRHGSLEFPFDMRWNSVLMVGYPKKWWKPAKPTGVMALGGRLLGWQAVTLLAMGYGWGPLMNIALDGNKLIYTLLLVSSMLLLLLLLLWLWLLFFPLRKPTGNQWPADQLNPLQWFRLPSGVLAFPRSFRQEYQWQYACDTKAMLLSEVKTDVCN